MVRTRASYRLNTANTETADGEDDTPYKALQRLEKLERELRSKKPAKSSKRPTGVSSAGTTSQSSIPPVSMSNSVPRAMVPPTFQNNAVNSMHQQLNPYQIPYTPRHAMNVMPPLDLDSYLVGWDIGKPPMNNYPVHPDVKLKRLPFYDFLGELIKPTALINVTSEIKTQDFKFNLTPQEAQNFNNPHDTISIQLRFCPLETSCEQDDCFPPCLLVRVNGKNCQLPSPIPTNKVIVEPKRPPGPLNITSLSRLCPMSSNIVSISWKNDFGRQFVFAVAIVRKLTSAQLLTRLKNKGTKHSDFTRSLIKEKLREDLDCEIATTSLRVSLVCPLGKMRMICPCRPSTCLHLQCFDASLFLQMNERKSSWICPVCDKPALFDNLVVDGYFQDVLNSPRLEKDCTEIQLHKDGSWSVHFKDQIRETVVNESSTTNIEIIGDDTDIIPLSDGSDSSTGLPSLKRPAPSNKTDLTHTDVISDEIIDLISDDSDDELPLKRKTPNPPKDSQSLVIESCDLIDSTTEQSDYDDAIIMTRIVNNRTPNSTIITLDSPSPLACDDSPADDIPQIIPSSPLSPDGSPSGDAQRIIPSSPLSPDGSPSGDAQRIIPSSPLSPDGSPSGDGQQIIPSSPFAPEGDNPSDDVQQIIPFPQIPIVFQPEFNADSQSSNDINSDSVLNLESNVSQI